jgi:CCR4-NOT transcription complex subunit 3
MTSIGATGTSVPETVRSPVPLQQPQQQQQSALVSSPLPPTAQTQAQQPQFPPGVKLDTQRPPSALQPQQPAQRNAFPGSLSDLVASFETVKQKGGRFFTGSPRLYLIALVLVFPSGEQRHTA